MKPQKHCFSILAALLTSLSILPAQAGVVTLFQDDFAYASAGNNTNTSSGTTLLNHAGRYSFTNSAYQAGGAVKLGTASLTGSVTTTNLAVQAGSLHVQVDVKGWTTVEGQLLITVAGQSSNITYTAAMSNSFETVSANFGVATGSHTVSFATTAKRCFLDNIFVTQDVTVNGAQPVFSVTGAPVVSVEELTPISFTVDAKVDGNSTNVTCATTLPTGASYVFENSLGEFNWTPALGQSGSYSLAFTAYGSDAQSYTSTVNITVTALMLTAPANLAVNNVKDRTFDASWNSVGAATDGYVVDAWYGSSALNTPNADFETFFEISSSGSVVAPLGWTFIGLGTSDKYAATFVELKLTDTGKGVITKLYPKAVTNLAFRVTGYGTTTTNDSALTVSGSENGVAWTEIKRYSSLSTTDGYPTNSIVTSGNIDKNIALQSSSGYRQFKFVYTKDKGNIGIGNIAAMYEGAGTKFIPGWEGKTTLSTMESIAGAKPARTFYLRVGAKNATDTKYSTIRFQTLEAPATTLITVR